MLKALKRKADGPTIDGLCRRITNRESAHRMRVKRQEELDLVQAEVCTFFDPYHDVEQAHTETSYMLAAQFCWQIKPEWMLHCLRALQHAHMECGSALERDPDGCCC